MAGVTIIFTVVLGLGMVGAIVYVLQRYLAERQQAGRSLARLAAIVESSDDAILSKSRDGIIQTWNAGAERLFGYRAAEVIGQPVTLLQPPERIQEEAEILDRLLSGQRVEHLETVRVAKDGRRIDVSVTVSPLKGEDGQITGASKIVHDITERKRAEEELRRLKDELEYRVELRTAQLAASNRELEAFSYTVSHDLAAPLRHISSFLALLKEEAEPGLSEQCRHYTQNISEAADRMAHLIDDLLTFSRIGRATMTVQPVALRQLVNEARTELASEAGGRTIDWQIGPLPEVLWRPGAFADRDGQSAVQRHQVHAAPQPGTDRGGVPGRGGRGNLLRARQRRRFRHEVCGQAVRRVPTLAPGGGFRRDGHRTGQRAAGHPPARRQDLGRRRVGSGRYLLLLAPSQEKRLMTTTMLKRILLAEDDPKDVELALKALGKHNLANEVQVVRDGAEALDYLFQRGEYATRAKAPPPSSCWTLRCPRWTVSKSCGRSGPMRACDSCRS